MKLEINENNMVRVLRDTFSKNTNIFTEMIQNARRAGATKVYVDANPDKRIITFIDDGEGIKDFQKLFTLAESGYSEEVVESENPFGLGFLSAVFRAKKIKIASGAYECEFKCKELLDGKSIGEPTKIDTPVSGTVLTLLFPKDINVLQLLPETPTKLLSSFPLEVFINNTLYGGHTPNKDYLVETSIGVVDTTVIQGKSQVHLKDTLELYYQYLPINPGRDSLTRVGWKHSNTYRTLHNVDSMPLYLHNDTKVRMPERDYILEPEKIKKGSYILWNIILDQMKKDLESFTDKEFVLKWFNFIFQNVTYIQRGSTIHAECKKLFNNIPVVTGVLFSTSELILPSSETMWDIESKDYSQDLYTKSDLEAKAIITLNDERQEDIHNVDLVLTQVLDGFLCNIDKLDPDHWLCSLSTPVTDKTIESIILDNVIDKSLSFDIENYVKTVVITDNVTITFKGSPVDISKYPVVVPDYIIIPAAHSAVYVEDIVMFMSNCYGEWDTYQESIYDYLVNSLSDIIDRLLAGSQTEYHMQKIIRYAKSNFGDVVNFDIGDTSLTINFPEKE